MGWVHNLQHPTPQNDIVQVIAICLTCSILALVAVALRFHVRFYMNKSVWVDDYAALSSALLGIVYAGLAVAQTRWGLGLDEEDYPIQNDIPFSKLQYAGGPVYTMALLGFKISLLALYLRIGGFVHRYRVVILGVIAACVCNQVTFALVHALACRPVAKQWEPALPGTCIDIIPSYYGLAGTSLGFDVVIIALLLPILARLQLDVKQKLMLVCLFGLGLFVTIIQVIRILTIKNLKNYTNSEPIIVWSTVEISLGVIISCVPTYAPYFRAFAINVSSLRQSYCLSPNMKNESRVFDNNFPSTGVVGSRGRLGSGDSQASILQDTLVDWSTEQAGTSPKGIRIATEVGVESRLRVE
ncbi:hypothetical protein BDV18DRAFT_162181 [Aspergillus unguis]